MLKLNLRRLTVVFGLTCVTAALPACESNGEMQESPTYTNVPTALPGMSISSDCEISSVSPAEWASSVDVLVAGTISAIAPYGPDDFCEEITVFGMEVQLEGVEHIAGVAQGDQLTFVVPGEQINDWLPQPIWNGRSATWFPSNFEGAVAPGMRIMTALNRTADGYVTPNTQLGLVSDDGVRFQIQNGDRCFTAPAGDPTRDSIAISDFSNINDVRRDMVDVLTVAFAAAADDIVENRYVDCNSEGLSFDDPCDTQADCLSSQTCIDGYCIDE